MSATALLLPVPRLEPLLAPWRRYDPSAELGIPTHLTVLYPWLPAQELTGRDLRELAALADATPVQEVRFTRVGVFPQGEVLHLVPDPDAALRALTDAVHVRWPQAPPYEGRVPDPDPHVTVGHAIPRHEARQATRALTLSLPVRTRLGVLQLWADVGGTWESVRSYPLAPVDRAAT